MIRFGAVKQPMQVDKIMNQTDLAATLLGQFGLNILHLRLTVMYWSDYKYPLPFL